MSSAPRYAGRRLPIRRPGLLATLLVAMLSLTGCVTVQLKASVHSDDTVSGSTRIGVAKSLATLGGGSAQTALDQLRSEDSCDFGGKRGTTKDFDDGSYVGIDCSFSGVTLAEFNSGEDGPKLTRVGAQFRLAGSLNLLQAVAGGLLPSGPGGSSLPSGVPTDLPSSLPTELPSGLPTDLLPSGLPTDLASLLPPTGGLLSGLDPSTLLKTAKISFAFTFPGKVKSSAGKVHGNTATFTPDQAGNINFETTAAATGSSWPASLGTGGWLGLLAVLVALLAMLGWLLRRHRAAPRRPAFGTGYPYSPGQAFAQSGYPPGPDQPAAQPSYPGQPGYAAQPPYPAQPYPTQPYPVQPYPAQPSGDQPYLDQPYFGPPASAPPFQPGQPYRPAAEPVSWDQPAGWDRPPAADQPDPDEPGTEPPDPPHNRPSMEP